MSQPATISLVPLNSLPSNARQIPLSFLPLPVGRTLSSSPPSPSSLKFSSKVVSRQHAIMGYTDGKLWIQDTKSSSGTFVNSRRLSPQGVESAKTELCDGDVIRLGEDCEVNGVIHNAVIVKLVLSPSSSAAGHYRHPHYQQQQQTFFPQHQLQESLQHLDPQTTTSSLESIHEKNAYWREKEHEKDREYM
ncbi:hypothetical protein BC832DRAFT_424378 [Gaertneriomyces semiglobifer]|nr:hypothetical protein BC832DRAFT_424378 [Gaertneriomyces semiglobifer]